MLRKFAASADAEKGAGEDEEETLGTWEVTLGHGKQHWAHGKQVWPRKKKFGRGIQPAGRRRDLGVM